MGRRVSLLAVGGTISTRAAAGGAMPHHGAEHLAGGVRRSADVEVHPRDVSRISSRAMTPLDMWRLAEVVREEVDGGADGVVVTHGTDTLEETAYALELLVPRTVPVVLTGAMRTPEAPGADGPGNLAAAVTAAADPRLAAHGPVVVFQDEVHAARWVTKHHSTRVAAFASPVSGPVGTVVEDGLALLQGPPPGVHLLPRTAPPSVRVEVLMAVAGADGFVVDAIAGGVDGLVLAGTGGGHAAPPLAEALVRVARSGTPVGLASRCAGPRVLRRTYGGTGSEVHLLSEGLLQAGSLSAVKARLRLLLGLSAGLPATELFPPTEEDT